MKKSFFLLPVFVLLLAAQDSSPVAITSPAPKEVLRGQVDIFGSTNLPGFVSALLDFAYASSPADTWFPLQTLSQPVLDAPIYTWDTTTITDGDYILRLRVFAADGTSQEVTVPVKLANDIPPATATVILPTATPEEVDILMPTPFLLASSPTPTDRPPPTPTALPPNPAALEPTTILFSLGRGALVILGLFAFAGLILRLRRF